MFRLVLDLSTSGFLVSFTYTSSVELVMIIDALYPPPPPTTKRGISMKDLDVRIQHLEKEVEDLKKRLAKLEK